jgi:hypothetical protein
VDGDSAGFYLSMFVWGAKLYFETYSPCPMLSRSTLSPSNGPGRRSDPEERSEIDEPHVPAVGDQVHRILFKFEEHLVPGRFFIYEGALAKPAEIFSLSIL